MRSWMSKRTLEFLKGRISEPGWNQDGKDVQDVMLTIWIVCLLLKCHSERSTFATLSVNSAG
jgi:hypothetical protein